MTPTIVETLFEVMAFLFAISVHESAHAWTASLFGDRTARGLGRVSLNPIRHIELFGSIIMPLVATICGVPLVGWGKPTPVYPRKFRRPVLDDILTTAAGPISNFIVASGALLLLCAIALSSEPRHIIVMRVARGPYSGFASNSAVAPIAMLLFVFMAVNIVLAVFNLIPIPPLDGSAVLRHFLPAPVRAMYDRIGFVAVLALVSLGRGLLNALFRPILRLSLSILVKV